MNSMIDLKDAPWEIFPKYPITNIKGVSKYNSRMNHYDNTTNEEIEVLNLEPLISSLKSTGINLYPIVLDELDEVIVGGRRYLAAKEAGLDFVFAQKKPMTIIEKLFISFTENELQLDMQAKDRCYFAKFLIEKENMKSEDIANAVGREPATVSRWLAYDMMPKGLESRAPTAFLDLQDKKKLNLKAYDPESEDEIDEEIESLGIQFYLPNSVYNTWLAIKEADNSTLTIAQYLAQYLNENLAAWVE